MDAACPDENTLVGFMAGKLAAEASASVEAHVDTCSTCASVLATLGRARSAMPDTVSGEVYRGPPGVPRRWGNRYEVLEELGRGGMGTVYAARDTVLERDVALKILHPSKATGAQRPRLLREARALARITHPNVVAVYDAGEDGDTLFLTMERVRGSSLSKWLRTERPPASAILDAFRQAGAGLVAAHAAGVLHRDFKPENVLVGEDGNVRVTDFGLARPLDETAPQKDVAAGAPTWSTARLTADGAIVGTPAYMAPEQLDGRDVGHAADQYSFCIALRQALAGVVEVPTWVAPLLARGLEALPERRYPSMQAIVSELEARLAPPPSGHVRINAVLQAVAFVMHAVLLAVFVQQAMKSHPAPTAEDNANTNSIMLAIVVVYVVVWLPLGAVWTAFNAYGLFRGRRWASTSTRIYALTALPTCLWTPLGVYALLTLRKKNRDSGATDPS